MPVRRTATSDRGARSVEGLKERSIEEIKVSVFAVIFSVHAHGELEDFRVRKGEKSVPRGNLP